MNQYKRDSLTGTYTLFIGGYDWGPAIDRVYVKFDQTIDALPTGEIKISEVKEGIDGVEKASKLKIIHSFFVDENRKESSEPTNTIAFEMEVTPNTANPLIYSKKTSRTTWRDPYYLKIELANHSNLLVNGEKIVDLTMAKEPADIRTVADDFDQDSFKTTNGTTYDYAYYSPKEKSDTLVVWLHGGAKGGDVKNTDPSVILLASKASILAKDDFQNTIGNAHILAPQSPTMWMDGDGTNNYTLDGSSLYEDSLQELIDYYKNKVAAKKVVLAGASNGGYMSLRLAVLHPNDYDALIPICHGYHTDWLTNAELDSIKNLPMFFIYAENDQTLDPLEHSIPIVNRLRKLEATEVKVSATKNILDQSGDYTDKNGNPYEYEGHSAWIHFFNNDAADNDDGLLVFDWLAKQVKN